MTDEEFAGILALGRETSGVEFKGPGPLSNGRLMAQVVRALLAMANRQGGGSVIIGIEDNRGTANPVGLNSDDLHTWTFGAVSDQVARYADPSVSFGLETKEYNGGKYIVIDVEEFSAIPVLCKRSYNDVLRDGACYVRTRRKPETSDIPTQTEMRDLLDLAIDKGVSLYLERARRLGLYVPPDGTYPSDQEQFDEQLGDWNE